MLDERIVVKHNAQDEQVIPEIRLRSITCNECGRSDIIPSGKYLPRSAADTRLKMWRSMDLNANAFRIVQQLTTENKEDKRSSAARSAGKVGGPARARKLTSEQRRVIAIKANEARWKRA